MSKFATMTAGLLARKGDAMPSIMLPPKQTVLWPAPRHDMPASPPMPAPIAQHIERFATAPPAPVHEITPAPDHDKPRRLFVALSHGEYERLAIAAVKKNLTQHQIVHSALDAYFEKLAVDSHCECMGGACARGCGAN